MVKVGEFNPPQTERMCSGCELEDGCCYTYDAVDTLSGAALPMTLQGSLKSPNSLTHSNNAFYSRSMSKNLLTVTAPG